MTLETEESTRSASFFSRRGFRVVLGLAMTVALLVTVGVTGRLLAPEPTNDPCAAVPSELVREFFPDGSVAAVRMSLPDSSRQRCVWLPGADTAIGDAAYRRVQITFGLADRDAYLERMRSLTNDDPGSATDEQPSHEQPGGERGAGEQGAGEQGGNPSTVEIDDSQGATTAYRLATVQPGRTDGEHDIVVELSASVHDPNADHDQARDLVTTLAERLRPLQESALHQSPDSDSWMLADVGADPIVQLMSDGLGIADAAECARVPDRLLDDILGEHRRTPTMAGCSWQSDQQGRSGASDEPPLGIVRLRFGTADDPVTARDAYAELTYAADPTGYTIVGGHRTTVDELGDGVRSRIMTGTYVMPTGPDGDPVGGPQNVAVRLAEVVAIRGRTVAAVQYGTQAEGSDQRPPASWTDRTERAALHLVESLLTRP